MQVQKKLILLIPCYRDWPALEALLRVIDVTSFPTVGRLEVLVVDDCSSQPIPDSLAKLTFASINDLQVLRLRRNMGHQRAIVLGLCYIQENYSGDMVVVMDGDGEDDPREITHLMESAATEKMPAIVFARRNKRHENVVFKMFYFLYTMIFRFLTGEVMNVGNFSLLPISLLKNVSVVSEIWNHYSSGLRHSRLPCKEVYIDRAVRLADKSRMNLVSLITHGLSSIAVYGDIVGTRILLLAISGSLLALVALGLVIAIRFLTDWAIPGYATYTSGLLITVFFESVFMGIIFSMMILSTRNAFQYIPIRDYKYFIDKAFSICNGHGTADE